MIHNAITIDREASAVFAGAAGSRLVAVGGVRAEPRMNDRIKRLFRASSRSKRTKRGPRRCLSLGPLTCGPRWMETQKQAVKNNEQRLLGLLFERSPPARGHLARGEGLYLVLAAARRQLT
jgi:hypothetical protein